MAEPAEPEARQAADNQAERELQVEPAEPEAPEPPPMAEDSSGACQGPPNFYKYVTHTQQAPSPLPAEPEAMAAPAATEVMVPPDPAPMQEAWERLEDPQA